MPALKWPTLSESLFALKCCAAGMLAVYIALDIGLDRPFWALTTAYIVAAQPYTGTIRSRGLYRIVGTIVSALIAILIVPLFGNYSFLFILAVAFWVGFCLYISMLDRTPRSYIFRLSGYTAVIIAFPLFANPDTFMAASPFDMALARVEEIVLGISCSILIHSVFFPLSLDRILLERLDTTVAYARKWVVDTLVNDNTAQTVFPRRKLAQDITELRILSTHLPFDTSELRQLSGYIRALHDRLAILVMIVSDMEDSMRTLRRWFPAALSDPWPALLKEIAQWCVSGTEEPGKTGRLHGRIKELTPVIDLNSRWEELLLVHLAVKLHELTDALDSCNTLRLGIDRQMAGSSAPARDPPPPAVPNSKLHTEKRLAFRSAIATGAAIVASSFLWIATEWPEGYYMPMYSAIICSIHAMRVDPSPNLKSAFLSVCYAIPISVFYMTVVMPHTHTFEMLLLVLMPFLLLLGYLLIRSVPGISPTLLLLGVVGILALYDYGAPDASAFFNGQVAQLTGMGIGIVSMAVFRQMDLEKLAYYLIQACWLENTLIGHALKPPSLDVLAVRMTDRLALIVSRLATVKDRKIVSSFHIMGDIRVSLNMVALRELDDFVRENRIDLQAVMETLSHHFYLKLKQPSLSDDALLHHLDRSIYQASALPRSAGKHRLLSALVGLRADLFPASPFHESTSYLSRRYT